MNNKLQSQSVTLPSSGRTFIRGVVVAGIVACVGFVANGSAARAQAAQMVDPNRIVMVVNGEEIKGAEYYRRMENLSGVGAPVGGSFSEATPGYLTLQQLIKERLIFALARDKGVYPSDDDVNAEVKVRLEDNPKMTEEWTAAGGTSDELKYRIRVQLAQFNIQTLGISKTDAEVEQFYNDHPDLYTTPKQLKLRVIAVISADDTKVVDLDLASGKDFGAVAAARSVDGSKERGGEYGIVPEDRLAQAARTALSATKVGQTTAWLTTAAEGGKGAYLKFLLEDLIPSRKLDLNTSLRRLIRRKLMLDIGHIKNGNTPKELEDERAKAKIEVKVADSVEPRQLVDPNRVIVVINGESITGAEYYRRMEYLEGVGVRIGNSFSALPPGFLTLRQLVRERVEFDLAKEAGVYPTDAEVDAEIKTRQQENPKMLDDWAKSGASMDELRYALRAQIAEFKVQTFGITITDTEVEKYYRDHPDVYTSPKQFKLRIIAVAGADDKNAVDKDLAAGKDFAAVAKERSFDATKEIGGEYGTIPDFKLSPAAHEALIATKIGQITKWLSTVPEGGKPDAADHGTWLKFLLEDVIPGKKLELDTSLRRMIRRELMAERGKTKNGSLEAQIDQRLAKAKVDIKQPEFADAFQRYVAAVMKQKGTS